MAKSDGAFRTIGELADELGVAHHILRYWETRFPQLRPIQRAGNRRYYRPEDVALARRIHRLLGAEGYTVRGVQALLAQRNVETDDQADAVMVTPLSPAVAAELAAIRALLAKAMNAAAGSA